MQYLPWRFISSLFFHKGRISTPSPSLAIKNGGNMISEGSYRRHGGSNSGKKAAADTSSHHLSPLAVS